MSATNRGSNRSPSDFYETPAWAVEQFLDEFYRGRQTPYSILEPCAGSGAIIEVLRQRISAAVIDACEIEARHEKELTSICNGQLFIQDFRTLYKTGHDLVITNPPFSLAQEIIEHVFATKDYSTEVVMLLRLGFLESQKRKEFWDKHPLTQLYVLSERPSFTKKGTDSAAYGWFVWSETRPPLIKVI